MVGKSFCVHFQIAILYFFGVLIPEGISVAHYLFIFFFFSPQYGVNYSYDSPRCFHRL